MEVLRRCPIAIAQRLVHCAIALSTAVLDRVTKTMSVAPLLTNNLDNSKQKTSNLLSPAPPPYSWSLLGKSEGPAPPPSSKIFWSRLEPCGLMIAVLCLCSFCGLVAEWFRRQTNLRPPGVLFICQATDKSATSWFMRAVSCLCSFCGLLAEWFRRQTNLRPAG